MHFEVLKRMIKIINKLDYEEFRLVLYSLAPLNPFSSDASLYIVSQFNQFLSCHISRMFHCNTTYINEIYKPFAQK